MKYKIYCGDKQYKIPKVKLNGYGDVVKAPWGEDVALKLLDGDTVYLKKDWDIDGNGMPVLYINLESGNCCSVFYSSPANGSVYQTGYNWICQNDILAGDSGDVIRIYKFGDESFIYDTGLESTDFYAENNCKKYGTLVAIIAFIYDNDGDEAWRLVDPNNVTYNGQWIDLPAMNDRLFISSMAYTEDGFGFYYLFESGAEGVGFLKDAYSDSIYMESYEGWFGGERLPQVDDEIWIYQCGDGWYEFQEDREEYFKDSFFDFQTVIPWFNIYLGQPIIVRYNEDTHRWDLIQEGDRNDF